MDSLITAAARALALGDALGALNHIALRNAAPATALRAAEQCQASGLRPQHPKDLFQHHDPGTEGVTIVTIVSR
jgi:hypothetical protein